MHISTILLSVLLLQLPLLTFQTPVKPPASTASKGKGQESGVKKKPPINLDLEKTPLRQLIDMKPIHMTKIDGGRFKLYFANHPKVRKIDLQHPVPGKAVGQLLDLTEDGTFDKGSKRKMAASIDNLIEDTPFKDEQHKALLKETLGGARFRFTTKRGSLKHYTKIGKEEMARRRQVAGIKYHEKFGQAYSTTKKWIKNNTILDMPLSSHLDTNGVIMTPRQAEIQARNLGAYYSSEQSLTKELERYLKQKQIDPQEIATVLGIRQWHNRRQKRLENKAVKRHKDAPSTSGSGASEQHANTDEQHLMVSSISSLPSPASQTHFHQQPRFDPNDPNDWKLLEDFLKD